MFSKYSWTSCKAIALAGGGCLQELTPYWVNNLLYYHKMITIIPCFKNFIHTKSQSREISDWHFSLRISIFCTILECHYVTTFYYPVHFPLSVKFSLTGGEKQKKISTFTSKVVMVTCESWSCTRAGHNWSVNVLTHVSISFRRVKGSPKNLK